MNRIHEALLLAALLLAIAMLAVAELMPEGVAQVAPLAMLPFLLRRRPACAAQER